MGVGAPFPDGVAVGVQPIVVGGVPEPFEVPQRYYEFSFTMAHFPAPTRLVRALLPDDSLQPVQIVPGLAVITIAAFEYRVMATLKPYKEVAIMVPVRHQPERNPPALPLLWPEAYDVGFWIDHLPVTTEQAQVAGVTVWGLPKVLATITFEDVGWMRRCRLREDGQDVLVFSAPTGETRFESRAFHAYSLLNGTLLRTLVDTRGQYRASNVPGCASLELGSHPVASRLRATRVQNIAVAGLFGFTVKSILYPGQPVAAGAAAGGS
ncbi:MAG TPA: acetoacetate decarboxylase family protein [Gemmatimonadales bacterium]|nr:acetoacetate decarboxylase family protein [Gemmatimonadales bacterium]